MKLKTWVLGILAFLLASFGVANAALPTAATDAITTVQTDALAMVDAVWPYVAAITVAFVIYRIFKRAISAGG